VCGLVALAVAFGVGVESTSSTVVAGHRYGCGTVIPASWLVAGSPTLVTATPSTDLGRRVATACGRELQHDRTVLWVLVVLGGVVAVAGWTALRERRPPGVRRPATAVA
jgi:hypothetical protein